MNPCRPYMTEVIFVREWFLSVNGKSGESCSPSESD